MIGFYKNHFVDLDDAFRRGGLVEFSLSGIIKDMNIMRSAIFLKIIDLGNLIDTHKVYVNFKEDRFYQQYKDQFKKNMIVYFKNSLKQTMSKKLEIVYSVNVDKFTEFDLYEDKNYPINLHNTKTGWRIKENLKNVSMPLINIVDLEP